MSNNVTCNTVNIQGITPGTINLAYIKSQWNPVNVQAMTACCAPATAKENGCFTWCPADATTDKWKTDFQACLQREGTRISGGNTSYVAPEVVAELNAKPAAATTAMPGLGVKGVMLVALGVVSWVFA